MSRRPTRDDGSRTSTARHPFIIVTGLSGSGKSQAIRALEDLGYFCVDNLPTALIPTLAQLAVRGAFEKAAIVADAREQRFLSGFPAVFRKLKKTSLLNPVLIFLESSNEALVRRFLDELLGCQCHNVPATRLLLVCLRPDPPPRLPPATPNVTSKATQQARDRQSGGGRAAGWCWPDK